VAILLAISSCFRTEPAASKGAPERSDAK
jgi:hypothetical protein